MLTPNSRLPTPNWHRDWELGGGRWGWLASERQPESELHRPVLPNRRFAVIETAFLRLELEVGAIEQVEGVGHHVERDASERDALLDAQVGPVLGRLHERIARHDGPIGTQPLLPARAEAAAVAAVARRVPRASGEVVETAHLE